MGIIADAPLDAAAWVGFFMRRVLVVADVSAEHVCGGAERMLFHHIRALKADGFAVAVLTRQPTPDAPLCIALHDWDVSEYRLAYSGVKGFSGLKQLKQEARLWWKKHQVNYDLVVAEQPFVMWALLQAGCRLPRLQVVHSFAFEEYQTRYGLSQSLKHRLAKHGMKRIEASVYQSANTLMTLSVFMQQRLQRYFEPAGKLVVVPGCAEFKPLLTQAERQSLRAALGGSGPVVSTLRNLVPRTGVDLLVQAAAVVKHQRPDVRWIVVGDGHLKDALISLSQALHVDDVIRFAGFLSEDEVLQTLQASDVFMVPTRGLEGFGLVTLEANVCGTPVLATPIAANVELVPSIRHNRLAASASPNDLATALLDMLANPLSQQQREEVHADATTLYHWDKHDQDFVALVAALDKEKIKA